MMLHVPIADAVERLLRGYVDVVTDAAHAPGCLVVNSSPSSDADDELRRWLAGHREALRLRLYARFADVRTNGGVGEDADPLVMARFVTTLAGGIAVDARSGATRDELYATIAFALRGFAGRAWHVRSTARP